MKKALFLLVLLAPFAFASSAQACSPALDWPPSPAENVKRHDTVFVGTVASIIQDKSSMGQYHITFTVNETFKGAPGEKVTVLAQSSSAACGYDNGYELFKQGTVWAIYANKSDDGTYQTGHLDLNTKYDSVTAARAALAKTGMLVCTTEYAPVCGKDADGKVRTLGNSCEIKAGIATKLYDGECRLEGVVPARDLMQGSRGAEVSWLQKLLISGNLGEAARTLAAAGPTGYFGQITRTALAEFQKANGIAPAFGYFGAKTRTHMSMMSQAQTFTGTISAVDTACFADGVCSVTVDGKKVIILSGMRAGEIPPVGSLLNVNSGDMESIGALEKHIGSKAEVYAATAKQDGYDYTLYGSTSYYVKVLDSGSVTSADNAPPGSIHNLPVPAGVDAAGERLATRLGITEGSIVILTAYERQWPDSCLGLSRTGEACAEVITPGYRVTMEAAGKTYVYRTNSSGTNVRAE